MIPILIYIVIVLAGILFIWRAEIAQLAASIGLPLRGRGRRGAAAEAAGEPAPAMAGTEPRPLIYTFGAYDDEGCSGGWAYVRADDAQGRRASGAEESTTRVRMELTAAVRALESLAPGEAATVRTGAQLVAQGMAGWVDLWERDGWVTGGGQPVDNRGLWERLYTLDAERAVRWEYAGALDGASIGVTGAARDARALAHTTMLEGRAEAPPVSQEQPEAAEWDSRAALLAAYRVLEQRLAATCARAIEQDDEWQGLVARLREHVEAVREGRSPNWSDGALVFLEIDAHAARLSALTADALRICDEYARTLHRASAEGNTTA